MFGKAAGLSHGLKLPVDVLGVALLANTHRTDDYHLTFGIDSIYDAVISELVLPVTGKRTAQRRSVSFGITRQLLLQHLSKLIPDAPIEVLYVCGSILRISKPEDSRFRGGR